MTELDNQYVAADGETTQFYCSVQSDLPVTFTWEFVQRGSEDSQVIVDTTGPVVPGKYSVINRSKSSRLKVQQVESSDAGSYTCRVSRGGEENIQTSADLEVLSLLCKSVYTAKILLLSQLSSSIGVTQCILSL